MPGKDGRKRQVLYDTSMIIGYLRGNKNCKAKVEQVRSGKVIGFISVIPVFELYIGAFLSANSAEAIKDVRVLLSWFQPPLIIDETIAQKVAYLFVKLQRSNELIELNDLFIGGTALTLGLPISTLNRSHFSRIPDLKILD
ncbi:MAG: type II toxin-antitoxin system VapC family toxin [candidate division KSB1 bacterium]|nr:type II toxin-antitoxin system VapC family toxin [candidate division KSB1 bacterium]